MAHLTPAIRPRTPAPAAWRAGQWLAAASALLACQALAATATAPADSAVQPRPGLRSLDKALSGEVSTGDRNLDLLLDAQRKGPAVLEDEPKPGRMPDRVRSDRLAGQPLPEPQRPVDPLRQPLPAPAPASAGLTVSLGQVLPSAAPTAAPRLGRDWSGNAGAAAAHSGAAGAQRGDGAAAHPPDLWLRDLIQEGLAFVKDHLYAILGTWAGIALLAVGVKAYSRRL